MLHDRLVWAGVLAAMAGVAEHAFADQVVLTPSHDATIYADPDSELADGAGQYLFAGNNGISVPRRALIRFDFSGIPAGSTIQQVSLKLTLSRAAGFNDSYVVSVYRLTTAWNEGPSVAPDMEGSGTDALPGDSTWIHTYYDTQPWTTPGGDFVATASSATAIDDTVPQTCTFGPTPAMAADVQGWVNAPAANFGWILVGDETAVATARRFNSRENQDGSTVPTLSVIYAPPVSTCVANCDHSTLAPFLNVQDFTCFLQKFAAQDPDANCDGSTSPPTLNVADFTCFLQKFAAGCSAP